MIIITIGAELAQVNRENVSESVKLDSPAFIEKRPHIPANPLYFGKKLGASVEWIEDEQKVVITKSRIITKNKKTGFKKT
ncbi:MAG: copper amine oxidase N-terminal domain-containing protein [Clostridiales bacterium]|nr:MAG: copper amine oxidase N-terminal domain-containing protein [Clostridiales bacterium]